MNDLTTKLKEHQVKHMPTLKETRDFWALPLKIIEAITGSPAQEFDEFGGPEGCYPAASMVAASFQYDNLVALYRQGCQYSRQARSNMVVEHLDRNSYHNHLCNSGNCPGECHRRGRQTMQLATSNQNRLSTAYR